MFQKQMVFIFFGILDRPLSRFYLSAIVCTVVKYLAYHKLHETKTNLQGKEHPIYVS